MVKHRIFPNKSRLGTFTALHQHQAYRSVLTVPQQTQPLGLQLMFCGADKYFRKPFRLVDQIKVTAVFQRPGCAADQVVQ